MPLIMAFHDKLTGLYDLGAQGDKGCPDWSLHLKSLDYDNGVEEGQHSGD